MYRTLRTQTGDRFVDRRKTIRRLSDRERGLTDTLGRGKLEVDLDRTRRKHVAARDSRS